MNTRISAAKPTKRTGAPNAVNGTVPPRRLLNTNRRAREYLTVKEVDKLVEHARSRGRYGHRDATMILVAYRHGLRASELCALRWDQVDLERGLRPRAASQERDGERGSGGRHRDTCAAAFEARANRIAVCLCYRTSSADDGGRVPQDAGADRGDREIRFPVHPHMLRHACGYKLANDGQDTRAVQRKRCFQATALSGSALA